MAPEKDLPCALPDLIPKILGLKRVVEPILFDTGFAVYQIVQVGSAASITEKDQFGFITAYGEGVVDGVTFDFNFTTAAFTTGSGSLSVDGSGTVLVGTFSDAFGSRPAELRR